MKKTTAKTIALLLLLTTVWMFTSCERPDRALRNTVKFERKDSEVISATYQGVRYLPTENLDGVGDMIYYYRPIDMWGEVADDEDSGLVLIGWEERILGYDSIEADTADNPTFIAEDYDVYFREDMELSKLVFTLCSPDATVQDGIALGDVIEGEHEFDTDNPKTDSAVYVTLHYGAFEKLQFGFYLVSIDGSYYITDDYGDFYAITQAFKTYLIKYAVIMDGSYV